ncbi:hypothetical protein ADL28_31840 [Streptomyces violaceusniger]|uniref:DUF4352 domain-containing protein n=2 Tax=Streptomyces violaceusniger group TaxID=2839105 RepID=A0ABD5JPI0_9ACTN|nr:hypothetical protein [Streptomyces violaceusniger]KUL47697.1 hypothetical protein ADL28_31840 [Streptomyces violaceusniger]MEE4589029.1 hypothetical protein [Streptomyces sp. DSM 41602]
MLNRPPHTTRFRAALVCALGITLLGLATAGCEDDTAASDAGRRQSATRADLATDGDGGKTLRLGEPTSITYKRGSDHMRGALRVTAVSVREGTHAELKKAGTEPSDVRTTQPYYVTMTFENVGENSLHYPFLNTPTGLQDTNGVDDQPLITGDTEVAACPGKDPDDFAVGAKVSLCKVFLVPNGIRPSVVTYSTGDDTKRPVSWKVRR